LETIERSSPVPYYEQLYDLLLHRIRSGEIERGARMPGESELHREFGLSRATVRQALELLESNGWAHKIPRRGYFARAPADPHGWLIEGSGGFLEEAIGHGNARVTTKVVSATSARLPDHATTALRLPRAATGFVLERIRFVDGEVTLFSTNFTPPDVAPVVQAAEGVLGGLSSLTQALRDGGYAAAGAHRMIHALPASETVARHLEVHPGAPLLRIRSTTWGKSLAPFDYYETWLRTDVVPLEVNVTARTASV
jgi:GntR family transcriptional regulator